MRRRRARTMDAPAIHRMVAHYAAEGVLLPRTEEEIRGNISHFLVLEENHHVVGCLSLEGYGSDLAEIRSVAVSAERRGEGLGASLIEFALLEAQTSRHRARIRRHACAAIFRTPRICGGLAKDLHRKSGARLPHLSQAKDM